MKPSWKITSINENTNGAETESVLIVFQEFWYQEDIEQLTETLFDILSGAGESVQVIERTLGADRENIRFQWSNIELSVHFECYSQSCWIELEPQPGEVSLTALSSVLSYAVKNSESASVDSNKQVNY